MAIAPAALRVRTAWALSASVRLSQLIEDGRVLQCRGVLSNGFPRGDRTQRTPHDLAAAGLGQVVREADVLRLGDGSDFLADPVAQFGSQLARLLAGRTRTLQHHEGADGLAAGF